MAAVHPCHTADCGAQAERQTAVDQAGFIWHAFAVLFVDVGGEEVANDPGEEIDVAFCKGFGQSIFFPDFKVQCCHRLSLLIAQGLRCFGLQYLLFSASILS